ncbi:thermonuclease family protein [Halogeometricum borinquense]|uniref:thermonuclease family protein n=1 Tax=Halogeometricum borinquense TaxID=60847 RepID=UPI003426CA90
MSRLIPLVVALLLVTAGCTSAGPQSSDDSDVTTDISTAKTVSEQTTGDAEASATAEEPVDDASEAVAEGKTRQADTGADDTGVGDSNASDGSESDSATVSTAGSSAGNGGNAGTPAENGGEDNANAGSQNDVGENNPAGGNNPGAESNPTGENRDSTTTETTTPSPDDAKQTEWTVTVNEIVEADTITVKFADGSTEEVKLVGVDAPDGQYDDSDFEGMPTEDGGDAWLDGWVSNATDFTREKVGGEEVTIRVDSTADRRDSQGRLLVYLESGGETLNEQLVQQGHAQVSDRSFVERSNYESAETNAQQGYTGLWQFFEPDPLDGGTETPDDSTETPDNGSETPDDSTETPDGGTETPTDETDRENRSSWTVTVENVVAGDRLEVTFEDGHTEEVQLLGVDTPDGDYDSDDFHGMAAEDGGEEWLNEWDGKAESFTSDKVSGEEVTIRVDSKADRRDSQGRLLVYVDYGASDTLNEKLIQQGYAQVSDRTFSESGAFEDAETGASQGYSGLWEFFWEDPLATETPTDPETPTETTPETETSTQTEAKTPTETESTATESEDTTETQTEAE